MADLNPFSKVFQKHAGRAKERLLQNLGKADRTTDEDFDLHVKNFNSQQNAVIRLQKEFKNYHLCLKAMQAARRSLTDTVCELYEPCWDGVEQFLLKTEESNKNCEDFCDEINCELLAPVGTYLCQFPDYTNKISKRKRKLLDYDNCRHNLQNLETMKKREDGKITKAKEQLEEARNNFEVINTELHEELPALYSSRVAFFSSHLQFLFVTEAKFEKEDTSILMEVGGILENLNNAYKRGDYAEAPRLHIESSNNCVSKLPSDTTFFLSEEGKMGEDVSSSESTTGSTTFSTPPTTTERNLNLEDPTELSTEPNSVQEDKKTEKKGDIEGPLSELNVLYQVQGTYKYAAEDGDELSFNVGDIIDVVEYDDPDEQEEGWLMGVFNGKKGLFPANFTSRI